MTLAIPTVHLNGDTREALMEPLLTSVEALRKAIEAVQATAPNARNFYVMGVDAYRIAADQHAKMWRDLTAIRGELYAIAEGIDAS